MENFKPFSSRELIKAKKNKVFLFLLWQFTGVFLVTIILYFTRNYLDAYSFLLGSMMSVLPSFYMALRIFSGSSVKTAQDIVKSFYKGEAGKFFITAILLSFVFIFVKPLAAELFFIGFGVTILSHWLSPVVIK